MESLTNNSSKSDSIVIPQYFIVETQFVEKEKLLFRNANSDKNEDPKKDEVVILSDDENPSEVGDLTIITPYQTPNIEQHQNQTIIQQITNLLKANENNSTLPPPPPPLSPPSYLIQKTGVDVDVQTNNKHRNIAIQATVLTSEKNISTLPLWPTRSRSTQKELKTAEKSIQCEILKMNLENFEEEIDDDDSNIDLNDNEETHFNKFIKIYLNEKIECLICGEIVINYDSIKDHYQKYHEQISVLCFYCGQTFKNQFQLKEHEDKKNCTTISDKNMKNVEKIIKRKKLIPKFCPFPLCNNVNYSLFGMNAHINCYHLKRKSVFGKTFVTRKKYNFKKYKKNSSESICKDKVNKRIILKNCIKKFQYKDICRFCYKYCKNSFELLNHICKNHLKSYKCLLCNEMIDIKSFRAHSIIHKNLNKEDGINIQFIIE